MSTGSSSPPKKRIYTLHVVRAVAAILVVFFHATQRIQLNYGEAPVGGLFFFGHCGVHFFFVLSGFVIFLAHQKQVGRGGCFFSFWLKRVVRIYPMHVVVLLMYSWYYYFTQKTDSYSLLLNVFLFVPINHYINPVTWVIPYEMLFYFLFSLLLLSVRVGSFLSFCWIAAVLFCLVASCSFGSVFCYLFSNYNVLFLFGVLAYFVAEAMRDKAVEKAGIVCSCGGVLLFVVATVYCLKNSIINSNSMFAILGYGLSCSLFVFGKFSEGLERLFQKQSILNAVGDSSYSIFLFHYPFIKWSVETFKKRPELHWATADFVFITVTLTSILLGHLLYRFIELPMTLKLNRWLGYAWQQSCE